MRYGCGRFFSVFDESCNGAVPKRETKQKHTPTILELIEIFKLFKFYNKKVLVTIIIYETKNITIALYHYYVCRIAQFNLYNINNIVSHIAYLKKILVFSVVRFFLFSSHDKKNNSNNVIDIRFLNKKKIQTKQK